MPQILLQNQKFSYSIIRKPIRSLRLRLNDHHSLTVSCPRHVSNQTITNFICQHTSWIIKNSSKVTPKVHLTPTQLTRQKIRAHQLITAELEKLVQKYHFFYRRVSVRNQKTRFGSCSPSGNLSFNWRIAFFPPAKFRHILLHELVHLTIKNHSPRFWAALAAYDPRWRQNRKWIKTKTSNSYSPTPSIGPCSVKKPRARINLS